jgi:hypothetical protein
MIFAAAVLAAPATAQQASPQRQAVLEAPVMIANPYTQFEWLIGDWYSKPTGGPDISIHQRFEYGPKNSYIFYTTLTAEGAKPEAVHFEGMAVWNGKTKALDYVVTSEPGSGAQELGTMRAEADGSIVREVLLTRANGQQAQFRQRFWQTGEGTAMTSLMRKIPTGWEPNFPGSERIAMSRNPI